MFHNKRLFQYLVLTVLLLVAAFFINAYASGFGSIKGKVVDQLNNQPLIGGVVSVIGQPIKVTTDSTGYFIIKNLVPGQYQLEVKKGKKVLGYIKAVTVTADITTSVFFKTDLTLTDEKNMDELRQLDSEISAPLPVSDMNQLSVEIKTDKSKVTSHVYAEEQIRQQAASKRESGRKDRGIIGGVQKPNADYYTYTQPCPPAHGGNGIVNNQAYDAMFFKDYGVNPFVDTEDDNLSTFATDVDDASYIMARSYINRGNLPPEAAIRTEEFINHFDYNYAPPRRQPFKIYLEGTDSRFGKNAQLLKIGIKGMEIDERDRLDANLVFVIDVSGSMNRENRMGLVKRSLRMLVDQLNRRDRVGIVIYGSQGQVWLEPTSIKHKNRILKAIKRLHPAGSTNAEEGIKLGYKMANQMFDPEKINRVILCSDGVANVGRTGPEQILKQIKKYARKGITLSAVGFGMGNYNDVLLEKLGNKGNGSYAYVDDINEAHRIFVENLTGNLQVIARDVKIQVDFNPDVVRSYRLIGYENRDVADEDFRNDRVDGGEIGAGHEVTALYEIKLNKKTRGKNLGVVYVRYKDAMDHEVNEVSRTIKRKQFSKNFYSASYEMRLAAVAAEFGEILRDSYWARSSDFEDLLAETSELLDEKRNNEAAELMELIAKANLLEEALAYR